MKTLKKIIYLLLTALMFILLGCGSSAPATTPVPAPPAPVSPPIIEKQWVTVKSWSGNGIKRTENFTITGSEWRVKWKSDGNNGIFILIPYKGDSSLAPIASTLKQGSDISYIHEGNGIYNISINAANTDWAIEVEELK
jgi:hypothetical protein